MFEKILSVLPYNPGLAHQLVFYSRRMREEAAIRRIGVVFMLLAFSIQFFAVISPPQSTSADSTNDMIIGGISSAADATKHCYNDTRDYKKIMKHFGIDCTDISRASTLSINKNGQNYYSAGHHPYGVDGETPVNAGGVQIYFRPLKNVANSTTFEALRVTNNDGKTFYILYDCGNLVSVGLPVASTTGGSFSGSGTGASLPAPTPTPTPTPTSTAPTVACTSLTAATSIGRKTLTTRLTAAYTASAPNLVNGITFDFGDGVVYKHNGVIIDHTYTNTGKTTVTYTARVTINSTVGNPTSDTCVTTLTVEPEVAPATCPSNPALPKNSPDCYCKVPGKETLPKDSPACYEDCKYNAAIPATSSECKPCEKSTSSEDLLACVVVRKSASNETAGVADANNSTAKASDVITYTLYAQNTGKKAVDNFVFQENLADVLDYADVVSLHGGTIDTNKVVKWPAQKLGAGETATHQITVKVKAVIPSTPTGTTDPQHFDLIMTNVYGNAVTIKLPGTPVKQIETAAASLPNTGPGTTLILAASAVMIAGYFYGRARLLADESDIAIKENATF